jgi:hypothetical protein
MPSTTCSAPSRSRARPADGSVAQPSGQFPDRTPIELQDRQDLTQTARREPGRLDGWKSPPFRRCNAL